MASAFQITLTIITIVTVQLDSPGISAKQVNFIDLENHAGDHTQTREKKLKLSDNYSKQIVATLYQQVNYVNFFDSPFQNQRTLRL